MTRISVPIQLRWSDFDAYAHVNNAEMLRILEEARIEAFWRPDASVDPAEVRPTAVIDARPGAPTISLIARQEVEYLAPIPYQRSPIVVELWIGHLGAASFQVCYEVFSPEGVEPRVRYTIAATSLVMIDAAAGRPTRIPDELRELFAPYVEAPLDFRNRV